MAQTAGGTYYAASSELVSSWPATSLDLANQLESRFAAKAPTASPTFTGTVVLPATTALVGMQQIGGYNFPSSNILNIDNVFSATYTTYIVVVDTSFTSGGALQLRLRASGTNAATNYFTERLSASGTSVTCDRDATTVYFNMNKDAVTSVYGQILISRPFASAATAMTAWVSASTGTTAYYHAASGGHSLANSYTGLALEAGGGNFNSGRVTIYGLYT